MLMPTERRAVSVLPEACCFCKKDSRECSFERSITVDLETAARLFLFNKCEFVVDLICHYLPVQQRLV